MSNFKGIKSEDFFLLAENRFMNSRSFYEEKKAEIKEKVILPLRAITLDVNEYMITVDPEMYQNPVHQVSRVVRDTRRTKDKTLYRENLWLSFSRYKKEYELYPSFWFELFQNGYTYGVGYFYSTPSLMECYRQEILNSPGKFQRIVSSLRKEGFTTYGEVYKKPKPGNVPKSISEYYNKKNFGIFKENVGLSDVALPSFSDKLIENFKKLAPMYRILLKAAENERHKED